MAGWLIAPGASWVRRGDLAFVGHYVDGDLAMSERRTRENLDLPDGSPGPGRGCCAQQRQMRRLIGRDDWSAYDALDPDGRWRVFAWGEGDELACVLLAGGPGEEEPPADLVPGARAVLEEWAARQEPPPALTWSERRHLRWRPEVVCDGCGCAAVDGSSTRGRRRSARIGRASRPSPAPTAPAGRRS